MDEIDRTTKREEFRSIRDQRYHENGAFLWIIDPDGNKIELWEPKVWDDKNKK